MGLERLHRQCIRHPWRTLAAAAVVTLAAAPGLLRLELRTDGAAMVPRDAAGVREDREIRDEFRVEDDLVVVVRASEPEGIFHAHTLRLLRDLTADLQAHPEIGPDRVTSLATERGHRVRTGSLSFRTFLDPLPATREARDLLRSEIRDLGLYSGTLVSRDESHATILVGVPAASRRIDLLRDVEAVAARHATRPGEVSVIGAPAAEALLGTCILEDLGIPEAVLGRSIGARSGGPGLLPLVLLVVALVFGAGFRSLAATVLPLTEVGACLVAVFGLMGLAGVPIYLTTPVLPVVLTVVGVTDEVHIFARYAQLRRGEPGRHPRDVVRRTMDEMVRPVVKTSITTAVGFLSFALSPIAPIRSFGLFAAVGIVFCMIWSLSVIPALLVLLGPRVAARKPAGAFAAIVARAGRLGTRRPRTTLAAAAALAALCIPAGVARLRVQDSWIGGFPPGSGLARDTAEFHDRFLGTHVLRVRVSDRRAPFAGEVRLHGLQPLRLALPADRVEDPEALVGAAVVLRPREGVASPEGAWSSVVVSVERAGDEVLVLPYRGDGWPAFAVGPGADDRPLAEIVPQALTDPDRLRRTRELEEFVREGRLPTVGGVLGPVDYLETTRYVTHARRSGERAVPEDPREIRRLWESYDRVRGDGRLRQLVRDDYRAGLVSIFLRDANFADTAHLLGALRSWSREHLEPHGLAIAFGGDVAVSQALIGSIVRTQVGSLLLSLAGILATLVVFDRSFRRAACCTAPCALAVATVFAAMGWQGTPLGVATSVFAGITLGIGVDFAIHLADRYDLAPSGLAPRAAMDEALRLTGPAILIDALAILLGFSVLFLSAVPANARLGGVVVVAVGTCLAATLVVVPALAVLFLPRSLRADEPPSADKQPADR